MPFSPADKQQYFTAKKHRIAERVFSASADNDMVLGRSNATSPRATLYLVTHEPVSKSDRDNMAAKARATVREAAGLLGVVNIDFVLHSRSGSVVRTAAWGKPIVHEPVQWPRATKADDESAGVAMIAAFETLANQFTNLVALVPHGSEIIAYMKAPGVVPLGDQPLPHTIKCEDAVYTIVQKPALMSWDRTSSTLPGPVVVADTDPHTPFVVAAAPISAPDQPAERRLSSPRVALPGNNTLHSQPSLGTFSTAGVPLPQPNQFTKSLDCQLVALKCGLSAPKVGDAWAMTQKPALAALKTRPSKWPFPADWWKNPTPLPMAATAVDVDIGEKVWKIGGGIYAGTVRSRWGVVVLPDSTLMRVTVVSSDREANCEANGRGEFSADNEAGSMVCSLSSAGLRVYGTVTGHLVADNEDDRLAFIVPTDALFTSVGKQYTVAPPGSTGGSCAVM